MNYGLDLARELDEQREEDWKFGGFSEPCKFAVPVAERSKYMPPGEVQGSTKDDMSDCASRTVANILACKFTYAYKNNIMSPDNKDFMKYHGFADENGNIDFSDAYIAILSGTTRQGNSLKAPIEAARKHGMVPKFMLPLESWMSFEEYHDKNRITIEHRAIGEEFAKRFVINYEQVNEPTFKQVVETDMIDVALYAWPDPVNGEYPRVDHRENHSATLFGKPIYQCFDNYIDRVDNDFVKKLSEDYNFFLYGYRIYVAREDNLAKDVWNLSEAIKALIAMITAFTKPVPTPVEIPKEKLLTAFCLAIQKHEGWILTPPSRSVRNHNPGNCKFSPVGYLPEYGEVKKDPQGFAVFKDYETGFRYLKNLVKHKVQRRPNDDLFQFFEVYAPREDNNDPIAYAKAVATRIGVDVNTFKVGELLL